MSKRVFKYPLFIEDYQTVALPKGARILSVQSQFDKVVLYAEVNETTETTDVDIFIHGTGHEMDKRATLFLGTVQLYDGHMVVHVFANEEQFYPDADVSVLKRLRRE